MIERRSMLWFALATITALPLSPALAFQASDFDDESFSAAQATGKPILIEVMASWCPTCKAQRAILSRLAQDPKFAKLVVFRIDFDREKGLLRRFGVSMQSTLISFKGSKEVGRSVGETDAASIEAQLDRSL